MMIQVYKPGNRNFDYNGDYNLKPITCELKMKLKGEWVVTLRNPLDENMEATNFYAVEIITQHHLGIIVTRYTPGIKCYGAYVLNENTGEVDTCLLYTSKGNPRVIKTQTMHFPNRLIPPLNLKYIR